jgi:transposase
MFRENVTMKETVTLNRKEQNRLIVLNQVSTINLTVSQAAKLLALSQRHVWRLLAAYRKEGALALAHGNRGQKPRNALDEGLRKQVQALAESTYIGFNTQHFTERLAEREGIHLSRSTVRRILLSAGISSPRKRRPPKHRSRRERYPQEGMLLQIDGLMTGWKEEAPG